MIVIALLCTLSFHGAAQADWGFTRWGMTLRDIRQAAPIKVSVTRHDERILKRISRESSILAYAKEFDWHGQRLEVRFGFDAHARLNAVFLVTRGDHFTPLEDALTRALGIPRSRTEIPLPCRVWFDAERGDFIRLRRIEETIVEQRPTLGRAAEACLDPALPTLASP
jgi:hypothetical protein